MRAALLVFLVACHATPIHHDEPAELTLESAAACARAESFSLSPVSGTTWRIEVGDQEHVLDLQAWTCDDKPIDALPGRAVIDVLSQAAQCVQGAPWNGVGQWGSPLDLAHPTIHRSPTHVSVAYAEAEPKGKPAGNELRVDGGQCEAMKRE
jgi:hypothetical protein